ncbi:hypothetical protein P8A22_36270 [Streptomyces laculatispora]|uniref:Uncharacterized protein n=1 Tax=Streptomyces laculatispora TaxID=887464 RepID=A0ABY9IDY5_9ACTN|nr:hypothetical protein [Streptomyces laculatispora]WLQ44874.1 hypothetical protein P8A22_36270 [Streptomyces laculatispora]
MTMNTPFYAKVAAIAGRPLVLLASLIMSAPAEISLARTAGFHGGYELLAPLLLSLYAICAATIATARQKGDRGRLSAILGAIAAMGFALSAQVVAHLLAAGYMASGPWLVAAVSAVPAVAAAHLLHLGVQPNGDENSPGKTTTVGVTKENPCQDIENKSENDKGAEGDRTPGNAIPVAPRPKPIGRPKPSLQAIREAADTLDKTGQQVTSSALAKLFGVSDRTGARYKGMLVAA